MPTPFTHLRTAESLLSDPAVPAVDRALLNAHRPAYLLGSVIADAHAICGLQRPDTHFYAYDRPIEDRAWRVMLQCYPSLEAARDPAQRAFLAGYVMHLSMDELWSQEMISAQFAAREWGTQRQRFLMLNILLIGMDERDQARLDPSMSADLHDVEPHDWLPFMNDANLRAWGEMIYRQLKPGGVSETLAICGERVGKSPAELRAILDSPEQLRADLWANVPPEVAASVETRMNAFARDQMIVYLAEYGDRVGA